MMQLSTQPVALGRGKANLALATSFGLFVAVGFVALALLAFGLFAMGMVPSMQYRVVNLAGRGGHLASSLPASAANGGIALGAYAGGVAYGTFTASSTVLTGLIIAVISILVAWATSLLKPPVIADATEAAVGADVTPEPV